MLILSLYITAEPPDNLYKTVGLDIIRVGSEFSASNTLSHWNKLIKHTVLILFNAFWGAKSILTIRGTKGVHKRTMVNLGGMAP